MAPTAGVPEIDGATVFLMSLIVTGREVAVSESSPGNEAVTLTVTCLPRSPVVGTYVLSVAPVMSAPFACHWYE